MLLVRLYLGVGKGAVHRAYQSLGGSVVEVLNILHEVLCDLVKDVQAPCDGDNLLVGRVEQIVAQDAGGEHVRIGKVVTDLICLALGTIHSVSSGSFCTASCS